MSNEIPVGDFRLYDNYIPQLKAGNWTIKLSQTLSAVNADPIASSQQFVVSAPQFSMDVTQIVNRFPPAGSTGLYGNSLPHLVLNDAMLPWERAMKGAASPAQPWLALMIFAESDLIGGENNKTRTISSTVGDFLNLQPPTLIADIVKENDIDQGDPCSYIQMPVSLFAARAPLLSELRFLSHCRQVNTSDKAIMGLNENGLFSVIVSNQFPAAPPAGSSQPVKNIAHLVSLEGMENYLTANPAFENFTQVALLSMASWVFYTLPDLTEDFRALALNIANNSTDKLWLKLPNTIPGNDTYTIEVNKRLSDGYVPLAYHARTGEDSFAWYRGPFSPVLPAPLSKPTPFFTSDAAIIYDKAFGLFDLSLATAWQAGREAALSDRNYGQRLLAFRKKAHRLTDSLYNQLVNDYFSVDQVSALNIGTTIQDELIAILDNKLIQDLGATPNTSFTPPATGPAANPDLKTFMAMPQVQALLQQMVNDDLVDITTWLARLLLFYPLPFNKLVADDRMLPAESIRFFYRDPNWADALLDGALSIGLDSSRQSLLTTLSKGVLHNGAMEALAAYRDRLRGVSPSSLAVPAVISGFLLRSALVSGWPGLAVRGYDAAGNLLNLLRMDHLSVSVLLCLFDGVPAKVELSEPQEGLGFGVDDDGNTVLRSLTPPDTGTQIGSPFPVRPAYMRASAARVLDITKLVAGLNDKLGVNLGAAEFALQMIKSPEAIIFNSQSI
ncbi:hypothetical protein [Chitinophaga sancti]|uniref:hypothetical protein n=1 Tax=Chitinophaga sancti TaxID=1004 RepID=UPI003F7A9125